MATYVSLRNGKNSLNKFSDCLLLTSVLLIFFLGWVVRNLNLSELIELIRTIQTCQKYQNLSEISKCVRDIQMRQNYPNVIKLLSVSASSKRISIIQTSQHHLNLLSSFEHGKLVNYCTL